MMEDTNIGHREWMTNVHRDSYASIIGHPALLTYLAVAHNTPKTMLKTSLIEKMVEPCGAKPPATI